MARHLAPQFPPCPQQGLRKTWHKTQSCQWQAHTCELECIVYDLQQNEHVVTQWKDV